MRLRYRFGLLFAGVLAVFLWGWMRGRQSVVPAKPASLVAQDSERLTVNPEKHTLTVLTSKGQQTLFLPNRATTIEITKAGAAVVHDKQIGFEESPFIGGMYGIKAGRIAAGVDVFYIHRVDLGVAVGLPYPFASSSTSVMAVASYNVWRDTRISVGVDQHKDPYVGITVRL